MFLVEPIAHVAPVNAHCEDALRRRQQVPITGLTLDTTRLFVPQLRFESFCYFEGVIAHRFHVEAEINRQKVLERSDAQPVRHQRGPLRFHIEKFRGDRLSEQRRQWAEGRGLAPLAVTMLQPRTGELTGAKQGAKRFVATGLELGGVPQSGHVALVSRKYYLHK